MTYAHSQSVSDDVTRVSCFSFVTLSSEIASHLIFSAQDIFHVCRALCRDTVIRGRDFLVRLTISAAANKSAT